MSRSMQFALVFLVAGCSNKSQQTPVAPEEEAIAGVAPAPPAHAESEPTVPDETGPLLTPEKAPDLKVQPLPAGQRVPRYQYPESFKPLHNGPVPAPTPIPVLPTRKPVQILGDRRFLAPGSGQGGVALSPDGKRLALGSCIFDAATGELDAAYDVGGNRVHKLLFSPDGDRLYCSVGPQGNVPTPGEALAVRDVPGKQQLLGIRASDWSLSSDGRLLATVESIEYLDKGQFVLLHYPAVRIYDTKTWKGIAAYRVRGVQPTAVALSLDGNQIVLGCADGAVRVWDRAAQCEVATFHDLCEVRSPTHKPIAHMFAFSPDGKTLAAANARPFDHDNPRQVAWWRWPEGTLIHVKDATSYDDPTDLLFSPDGQYLFTGRYGGARVWEAKSGKLLEELTYKDTLAVPCSISFAAADRVFAFRGWRPVQAAFPSLDLLPWPKHPFVAQPPKPDFETVEPMPPEKPLPHPHPGYALPGGGRVRVLRPLDEREAGFEHTDAAGKRIRHYEAGRTGEYAVSPDGKILVTSASARGLYYGAYDYAKWENPVRFWELATGKELAVIRVYPEVLGYFTFSPDGKRLAMLHADGLVRVWNVATREPILALDQDGYGFDRLTFSTDGRWLVGGGALFPILVVWDAITPTG